MPTAPPQNEPEAQDEPLARSPGRPRRDATGDDVRDQLLTAATDLFASRGPESASLRDIASAAGVTPAMISYYFGDKQGLVEAAFDRVFENLLGDVLSLLATPSDEPALTRFVNVHVSAVAKAPWVTRFILLEVLSPDSPIRERFVERFISRAAVAVPQLFQKEIDAGRFRSDVDPRLLMLSLVGMTTFPFLAHPVIGESLGYQLDEAFRQRLAEHTSRILQVGCNAQRGES